jgi:hypothetical protein
LAAELVPTRPYPLDVSMWLPALVRAVASILDLAGIAPIFDRLLVVKDNTTKLGTDADRRFGGAGGLGPQAVLFAFDPELGHLALDDARVCAQSARREDMPRVQHVSERLLAQGL